MRSPRGVLRRHLEYLGQQRGGVLAPTNVVRLYHSLHENDTQLRYYHSGVGTDRGLLNRLLGGGLGNGLSKNVKSAYYWLALHYQPDDAICLFGFSRGAYTVRSLAGMLDFCGLADKLQEMSARGPVG